GERERERWRETERERWRETERERLRAMGEKDIHLTNNCNYRILGSARTQLGQGNHGQIYPPPPFPCTEKSSPQRESECECECVCVSVCVCVCECVWPGFSDV